MTVVSITGADIVSLGGSLPLSGFIDVWRLAPISGVMDKSKVGSQRVADGFLNLDSAPAGGAILLVPRGVSGLIVPWAVVPPSGEITLVNLIAHHSVNPGTLEPTEDVQASWDLVLEQIRVISLTTAEDAATSTQKAATATTAATTATGAASAASGSASTAATAAGTAGTAAATATQKAAEVAVALVDVPTLTGLAATFATVRSTVDRWKQKLNAQAKDAKVAFVGDSTSALSRPDSTYIKTQMVRAHAPAGGGLAGMVAANIGLFGISGHVTPSLWADEKAAVIAFAPDLIIYSSGINDVRNGGKTAAQLAALITTEINLIRADLPNTDIVLRVPNAITADIGTGTSQITPQTAAAAQEYTDTMRNAYLLLVGKWANVVVWNAQDRVFGRTSLAFTATGGLMSDQVHPSILGASAIADSLVADMIGLPRRYAPNAALDLFNAARRVEPFTSGDVMDRANSTTSPGTASSGQVYTQAGTTGIRDRRLYAPAGGDNRVWIEAGIADGEFSAYWSACAATDPKGIIFRVQDASNFLRFRGNSSSWALSKVVGMVTTDVATGGGGGAVLGKKLTVTCVGTLITCYSDDVQVFSATITEFATATKYGVPIPHTSGEVMDLYSKRLAA